MNQFKRKLTAFGAMLAFLSLSSAASYAANSLDISSNNVLGKSAFMQITQDNKLTDVALTSKVRGAVGQVDWKNFSVARDEQVNFAFGGYSQTIINRVLGGNESKIMGKLTTSCVSDGCSGFSGTGKVILINPAGVLFGQGSQVDLNSFTVSTFDFTGAKNIADIFDTTEAGTGIKIINKDNAAYQQGVLNKFSPVAYNSATYDETKTSAKSGPIGSTGDGSIHFDSHYTSAFQAAGLMDANGNAITGKLKQYTDRTGNGTAMQNIGAREAEIALYQTTFDKINETETDRNLTKSIAILGDHVKYTDSIIRTSAGLNANSGNLASRSNVKIVTADGATFKYLNNGYANNTYATDDDQRTNVARTIDINNSGLTNENGSTHTTAIESGQIDIVNKTKASTAGSDIKISDSIIKANKLVNSENGEIAIVSTGDITIERSRLETDNTTAYNKLRVDSNGDPILDSNGDKQYDLVGDTKANKGGQIAIFADKNATVSDSLIITSGKSGADTANYPSGAVRIASAQGEQRTGNTTVTNTKIISDGDVRLTSYGTTNVTDTFAEAVNTVDATQAKNVLITGVKGVNITDTDLFATGDMDIYAAYASDDELTGDVKIVGTEAGKSIFIADKTLTIHGKNTLIDDAALAYNKINFYGDNTVMKDANGNTVEGLNNVTIKDGATFTQINYNSSSNQYVPSYNTTLETNGNFTLDNATVKVAAVGLDVVHSGTGSELRDDGSVNYANNHANGVAVTRGVSGTADADIVAVKSTKGNIEVKNNSNVKAWDSVSFDATGNGTYTQTNSSLEAGYTANGNTHVGTVSIASKGKAKISGKNSTKNNSIKTYGGDATITSNAADVELATATVDSGKDAKITAQTGITIADSTVKGARDVAAATADGNYTQTNSDVIANRNASITADQGKVDINGNNKTKKVEAGDHVTITGAGDVKVTAANIIAGSDSNNGTTGLDTADTADTVGIATIKSTGGALYLSDSNIKSQDDSVVLSSKDNIVLGTNITGTTDIQANKNISITSDAGNITGDHANAPTLTYGITDATGRLSFNATAGDINLTTANNSLKGVNVDYNAGNDVTIGADKDIQFVNTTFKGKNVTVNGGDDVILNNVSTNATTRTTINAKGDVTTRDITGTAASDVAATSHEYPQNVDVTRAYDTTKDQTTLDINSGKLVIKTKAPTTTPENNTKGSIDINLKNANGPDGIVLRAENAEGWDGDSAANRGPEVRVTSVDANGNHSPITVSTIVTDKLFLDKNDTFISTKATDLEGDDASLIIGSTNNGYIRVRDTEGFNLDPNVTTVVRPDGFKYDADGPAKTNPNDPDDTYKDEHVITFDHPTDDTDNHTFNLVYKIPTEDCEDPDDDGRDDDNQTILGQSNNLLRTTLPREQLEVSKTSKVADNTVDQTGNIMSAAAKVDLGQDRKDKDDDTASDED